MCVSACVIQLTVNNTSKSAVENDLLNAPMCMINLTCSST